MNKRFCSTGWWVLALAATSCRAVLGIEDPEMVAFSGGGASGDASIDTAGAGGVAGSGGDAGSAGAVEDAGQDAVLEDGGCQDALTSCSGTCVDLTTDSSNCGLCGKVCDSGRTCSQSKCECLGADNLDCSGSCIDVSKDAANCGACGRGCLGGGCEAKKCKAITLATNVSMVHDLDVSTSKVFFTIEGGMATTNGVIQSVPKDVGGSPTTVVSQQSNLTDLVVDTNEVVFFTTVFGMNIRRSDSGTVADVVLNEGPGAVLDMRVRPLGLYWIKKGSLGSIRKWTKSGGVADVVTDEVNPGGLDADVDGLYWTATGTEGLVRHAPYAGTASTIVPGQGPGPEVGGIAAAGDYVFFLYGQPLNLWSAVKTSGVLTQVTTGTAGPIEVLANSTIVYWSQPDGIYQRAASGGTIAQLIATTNPPFHIAMDGAAVYWTDATAKTVMKVAK